ncbi:MAG: hypothetical protein F4086_12730 [Gemmatimonadetes bacterium]|nr:hypothetical protein [Gammaproteobacteria bacterium]MYE94429.1 hypothetical protein [Gemmatimonadota bacterium]MYJ11171.1 hypothetical protein [Gemmatimonadota bacterium]
MIRVILMGTLALVVCMEPAEAQEWLKLGGEPDPLGRVEPVRFLKYATVIEPAESELEVGLFVFCGDEWPKATVEIHLGGATNEGASGAARIDGGETIDIYWYQGMGGGMRLARVGDVSVLYDDEGREELKAILMGNGEVVLSFEPFGGEDHFFRLNLAGLATRIATCESRSGEVLGSQHS